MKAILVNKFGSSENLKLVEMIIPEPSADEVLIKVAVAGVVFGDIQMREDDYVNRPELPFVPGREFVGTVVEVGKNVTSVKVGMRVGALAYSGGYAEYAVASEMTVTPLPDSVSFEQAIVYLVNFLVAYTHYKISGKIQPGETILIHAGAGGVGTLLTKIGKKHNNTVITLCSNEAKRQYCLTKGADYAINYREIDYVEKVLEITDGKGVDVSLNSVAGETFKSDYKAIRPFGRWVIYGYAGGRASLTEDIIDDVMHRSQEIVIASIHNTMAAPHFSEIVTYFHQWLINEPLDSVEKTFPLDKAAEAQDYLASRQSMGKIAIVP